MAKFKYRMQSILDIKDKMEAQTKIEYGLARARLSEEEEKLKGLKVKKNYYESKAKELLKDALKVLEIINTQAAVKQMEQFIEEQRIIVLAEERNVERVRVKLVEVMQERKTHEKLKEKAFEVFMQEENASESKEIDQLTSYLYGRRIVQE